MIIIKKSEFIKSAASPKDRLISDLKQVAVVGKSNVGKSTLINYLCNDSKIARTSKEPGRTRLINYFLINNEFFITDLPGYGFARVSAEEKLRWTSLIEDYLDKETMLCHVFMLIDVRHEPSQDDLIMCNYLFKSGIGYTIVATKGDKLSRAELNRQLPVLARCLKVGVGNILVTSSTGKVGKEKLLERLTQALETSVEIDEDEDYEEENINA